VPIGRLRWRVTIATRAQAPAPDGGIAETYTRLQTVRADVQPIGALTFWGAQQTDTPVTHRIALRWLDGIDNTQAILRDTIRADQSVRTEVFRIRRVQELNGRKRFLAIEAELERVIG